MSEPKWTPGPWIFEPHNGWGGNDFDGNAWPFGYISTSHPSPIFELRSLSVFEPRELEANADLIAAAPELYDALNQIVETWDYSGNTEGLNQALTALDKARGE